MSDRPVYSSDLAELMGIFQRGLGCQDVRVRQTLADPSLMTVTVRYPLGEERVYEVRRTA